MIFIAILAAVFLLDRLGVWLWLMDATLGRVGVQVLNGGAWQVRRSGKLCAFIEKLPKSVPPAAITLGRTVFLNSDTDLTQTLLTHELHHVWQWERWKVIGFLTRYIYWQFKYGYHDNPIERDARRVAGQP